MAFGREKSGECAACLKNSVHIFVEKVHEMGCLEGSSVPVLYIGRTVPKGQSMITYSSGSLISHGDYPTLHLLPNINV
jgi:hypothetical protein